MEVTVRFELTNTGFADRRLKPLDYVTIGILHTQYRCF